MVAPLRFTRFPSAVRILPSLVFGIGTILLMFQIGREVAGVNVGLTAAALAAVSGFLINYSTEVRVYGLVAFLGLVGTWAVVRLGGTAVSTSSRRPWTILFAASLVNLYCSPFALQIVAIHWAVTALVALPRPDLRRSYLIPMIPHPI